LSPNRITEAEVDRDVIHRGRIVDEEPEPLHHLRAYSNYLTPRPGLLSVDTWTVLTIYVRNALINLLLLLPLTMLAVLLGACAVWFFGLGGDSEALRAAVFGTFAAMLCVVFLSLGLHLSYMLYVKARSARGEPRPGRRGGMAVTLTLTILWPTVIAAAL